MFWESTSYCHRVYHSDTPGSNLQLEHQWHHNNHVGRWLTNFRATWDPKCDYRFACGSMSYPRQVRNIIHDHTLYCDNMTIVSAWSLFYPQQWTVPIQLDWSATNFILLPCQVPSQQECVSWSQLQWKSVCVEISCVLLTPMTNDYWMIDLV